MLCALIHGIMLRKINWLLERFTLASVWTVSESMIILSQVIHRKDSLCHVSKRGQWFEQSSDRGGSKIWLDDRDISRK